MYLELASEQLGVERVPRKDERYWKPKIMNSDDVETIACFLLKRRKRGNQVRVIIFSCVGAK